MHRAALNKLVEEIRALNRATVPQDTWRIRSDKDANYTAFTAQNGMTLEDLDALPNSQTAVVIDRVTVWSVQNLAWDVMLFRDSTSQPSADADADTMVDWVRFTANNGVQVAGTGLYRYSVSGINLLYEPTDSTFHVGLINRSSSTQNTDVAIELSGPIIL